MTVSIRKKADCGRTDAICVWDPVLAVDDPDRMWFVSHLTYNCALILPDPVILFGEVEVEFVLDSV